jgi:hypothetical protein
MPKYEFFWPYISPKKFFLEVSDYPRRQVSAGSRASPRSDYIPLGTWIWINALSQIRLHPTKPVSSGSRVITYNHQRAQAACEMSNLENRKYPLQNKAITSSQLECSCFEMLNPVYPSLVKIAAVKLIGTDSLSLFSTTLKSCRTVRDWKLQYRYSTLSWLIANSF